MNLFGLVVIVYFLLLVKFMNGFVKQLEKTNIFSLYIFLIPLVLEIISYFLKLDSFGLSKFLFPFLLFGYFVGFKKYERI